MEEWIELVFAVAALGSSIYVYLKNRNVTSAVKKIQEALDSNKTMFVLCPKCGEKITLTLKNVKEEEGENDDNN